MSEQPQGERKTPEQEADSAAKPAGEGSTTENAKTAQAHASTKPGKLDDRDSAKTEKAGSDTSEMAGKGPSDAASKAAKAYVDPSIAADARVLELESEISDLKDKFLRAHAEMENLRRRTEREKTDTAKYAISKFAGDMLAVGDNLQRAIQAATTSGDTIAPETKALLDGITLTETELKKALERHGVTKIEAQDAQFDPNLHQAVMEEENKDVPAGQIIRVFQEGFRIGERTLRPSMVVVARGGPKPEKPKDDPKESEVASGTNDASSADAKSEATSADEKKAGNSD